MAAFAKSWRRQKRMAATPRALVVMEKGGHRAGAFLPFLRGACRNLNPRVS